MVELINKQLNFDNTEGVVNELGMLLPVLLLLLLLFCCCCQSVIINVEFDVNVHLTKLSYLICSMR